jgi:hypothetical protein
VTADSSSPDGGLDGPVGSPDVGLAGSPDAGSDGSPDGGVGGLDGGLDGLPAVLADLVCWIVFFLQASEGAEVDEAVAAEVVEVIAAKLRALPVSERLLFLEHASARAATSSVLPYRDFLLEMAEALGLE